MYKIAGMGLIGLFIFMILPANTGLSDTNLIDGSHYGAATLVVHDINGNERFSQTIHNQLTDQGEEFLLDQVFFDGATLFNDNQQIATICVTDPNGSLFESDAETATFFDGNNTMNTDNNNCEQDLVVVTDSGVATIGPLNFNASAGAHNLLNGDEVQGIGICQSNAGNTTEFAGCLTGDGGSGILFSVINTSNVTLATGEDIDITYTFDISDNDN